MNTDDTEVLTFTQRFIRKSEPLTHIRCLGKYFWITLNEWCFSFEDVIKGDGSVDPVCRWKQIYHQTNFLRHSDSKRKTRVLTSLDDFEWLIGIGWAIQCYRCITVYVPSYIYEGILRFSIVWYGLVKKGLITFFRYRLYRAVYIYNGWYWARARSILTTVCPEIRAFPICILRVLFCEYPQRRGK